MANEEKSAGREPIAIFEMDLDKCALTYGNSPCAAAIGVTGSQKCFNTRKSCQDPDNYTNTDTLTLRFTESRANLPKDLGLLFPALQSIRTRPSKIDLETGIGVRAKATITLSDFPHHDRGIDPYVRERNYEPFERATFWRKLLARNPYYQGRAARIREGYIGQTLGEMQTRHYVIEKITGPDIQGNISIELKDILKLADGDRAKVPKPSTGQLVSDITAVAGSAELDDATGYPASGVIAIGDEAMDFTLSGATLTLTSRGAYGTEAEGHDAGDTVQLCYVMDDDPVTDVLYDVLTGYTTMSASNLPKTDWDSEYATWLNGFEMTGIIMKPTGVDEVCAELLRQSGSLFWYDEYDQEVKFFAIKPPPAPPRVLNARDHILEDSQVREEKPEERASQVYFYYSQINPTEDVEKPSNYRRLRGSIDTDAESADQYGDTRVKQVFARFLDSSNDGVILTVVDRLVNRLRDTPHYLTIALDAKDRDIRLGDLVDVESDLNVTLDGQITLVRYQVIQRDETKPGHKVVLRLQVYNAFQAQQLFAYVVPDGTGDFDEVSSSARDPGGWIAGGDPPELAIGGGGYETEINNDSPTGYWKLDETSGTTATDETGASDGTYFGGPTLDREPLIQSGRAVLFDGVDDYMDTGITGIPGDFTAECWARFSSLPNRNFRIMAMDRVGSQDSWLLWYNDSSGVVKIQSTNNGGYESGGGQNVVGPVVGDVYHFVVTHDGTTGDLKAYVNGVHVATQPGNGQLMNDTGQPLVIGADSAGADEFMPGTIDELAWYERKLTDQEIASHYEFGTNPPVSGTYPPYLII